MNGNIKTLIKELEKQAKVVKWCENVAILDTGSEVSINPEGDYELLCWSGCRLWVFKRDKIDELLEKEKTIREELEAYQNYEKEQYKLWEASVKV